jgi:hypothetical protein
MGKGGASTHSFLSSSQVSLSTQGEIPAVQTLSVQRSMPVQKRPSSHSVSLSHCSAVVVVVEMAIVDVVVWPGTEVVVVVEPPPPVDVVVVVDTAGVDVVV